MGSGGGSEVALGEFGGAPGEDGAKGLSGMTSQQFLERLVGGALQLEKFEQASDGVGDFVGRATVADWTGDGSDLADAAADAEIVGVDHLAVGFDFLAFDADVGDPVLAAGIGAAGDVQAKVILIVGETLVKLLGEPAGVGFGLGEGKLAKFGAGAGNGTADESGSRDGKAGGVEFGNYRGNLETADIDEEEILHGSGADVAVTVAFREVGGDAKLRGSDASAGYGSADGEQAVLLLQGDSEVIAVDQRGRSIGDGGVERIAETRFNGAEEGIGGPVVFEEKILETGFVSGLPEDRGFAEEFGDGADDGDDLVRIDEGVERNGEVRLGGEAAAYAKGKAEFVVRVNCEL